MAFGTNTHAGFLHANSCSCDSKVGSVWGNTRTVLPVPMSVAAQVSITFPHVLWSNKVENVPFISLSEGVGMVHAGQYHVLGIIRAMSASSSLSTPHTPWFQLARILLFNPCPFMTRMWNACEHFFRMWNEFGFKFLLGWHDKIRNCYS